MTYRDLVGDPEEYNPKREEGIVRLDNDVGDLLGGTDRFDTSSDSEDENDSVGAVVRVRQFLKQQGLPTYRIDIFEHEWYGTVQIDALGLSDGQFKAYIEVMRDVDGIEFDHQRKRHYCDPEWVEQLPPDGGTS